MIARPVTVCLACLRHHVAYIYFENLAARHLLIYPVYEQGWYHTGVQASWAKDYHIRFSYNFKCLFGGLTSPWLQVYLFYGCHLGRYSTFAFCQLAVLVFRNKFYL